MSNAIVRIVRREVDAAKNYTGMRAGLPKVTIYASHAEYLCKLADIAAERERELTEALIRARDALYEAGKPDSRLDRASAIAIADICAAKIDKEKQND